MQGCPDARATRSAADAARLYYTIRIPKYVKLEIEGHKQQQDDMECID